MKTPLIVRKELLMEDEDLIAAENDDISGMIGDAEEWADLLT